MYWPLYEYKPFCLLSGHFLACIELLKIRAKSHATSAVDQGPIVAEGKLHAWLTPQGHCEEVHSSGELHWCYDFLTQCLSVVSEI